MSFFDSVTRLPEDPILSIPLAFKADPRKTKVNLGVGSYLDDEGLPFLFPCVKDAERRLIKEQTQKEYAPIDGTREFKNALFDMVFGTDSLKNYSESFFGAQTIGGTGALCLGAEFLVQTGKDTIYLPEPTWPNHKLIFSRAGLKLKSYRYYDEKKQRLDFSGMCEDMQSLPQGSIILLQVCCQNPTGADLTEEQWKKISILIKEKHFIPFFDFAYQGFATGIEEDAFPVRHFAKEGHEMLVASSCSKNFGLYGERVGFLTILSKNKESIPAIGSQVKQIIRSSYSNPPIHGAQVVATVLTSPELKKAWLEDLGNLRMRIHEMRHVLTLQLQKKGDAKGIDRNWSSMEKHKGFFSLLGLPPEQVKRLIEEFGIYMPPNGRINIAGLNQHNMAYVTDSVISVM